MPPEKFQWKHLYQEVVTSGLCTGCAGCVIACPHDVLGYRDDQGIYKPFQLEDGFAPDVTRRLRALGYELSFVSLRGELREGYGAAVALDGKTVTAGADPRRSGAAGAVP